MTFRAFVILHKYLQEYLICLEYNPNRIITIYLGFHHKEIIWYKFTVAHFSCFVTYSFSNQHSIHTLFPWLIIVVSFMLQPFSWCSYCCLLCCPKCKYCYKAMLDVNYKGFVPMFCWCCDFVTNFAVFTNLLWFWSFFCHNFLLSLTICDRWTCTLG